MFHPSIMQKIAWHYIVMLIIDYLKRYTATMSQTLYISQYAGLCLWKWVLGWVTTVEPPWVHPEIKGYSHQAANHFHLIQIISLSVKIESKCSIIKYQCKFVFDLIWGWFNVLLVGLHIHENACICQGCTVCRHPLFEPLAMIVKLVARDVPAYTIYAAYKTTGSQHNDYPCDKVGFYGNCSWLSV